MEAIRVLLVDDQPSIRRGLTMRLQLEPDISVVGAAAGAEQAIDACEALRPDVLVMDYELPGMNGADAARALALRGCRCAIVMLTIHDNASVRQDAASAGVRAFVAKHEPGHNLLAAIRATAAALRQEEDTS